MIRVRASLLLLALLPGLAAAQAARSVTLSVTNGSVAMQSPTRADYVAGYVTDATPLTWTATVNTPRSNCTYTATVSVRATTTTIGNGKSIADVRWSNGGAYTTLTQTYTTIGSVALTSATPSRSGTLTFRTLLAWTESAASYAGTGLQFQVSATSSGTGC